MVRSTDHEALICRCDQAGLIPRGDRHEITSRLAAEGARITEVPDLCGAAARRELSDVRLARARRLSVVACHARAVRWLLDAAGLWLEPEQLQMIDARKQPGGPREDPASTGGSAGAWIPWFPVIDRERCDGCRQCASFCLFGVYEVRADGEIEVVRPDACKTNCPACARICPHAAIIFPKLGEEPLNGAEISDEHAVQAAIRINVDRLLGSDPMTALAQRQAKAKQRLLRRQAIEKAEAERRRCSCQCACAPQSQAEPADEARA